MKDKNIIVALDVDTVDEAVKLVDGLIPEAELFKIGSQLFTSEGKKAVDAVKEKGRKIFLDLKFHDIPNTVAKSARVATRLGVWMFNVHISGGVDMMKEAVKSSKEESEKLGLEPPKIIGVTILSSLERGDLNRIGIARSVKREVLDMAKMAKQCGLDGVVASCREVKQLRESLGEDFLIVATGARPSWSASDDQKRIATPREAFEWGADYVVIGRPITRADAPKEAFEKIRKELE